MREAELLHAFRLLETQTVQKHAPVIERRVAELQRKRAAGGGKVPSTTES